MSVAEQRGSADGNPTQHTRSANVTVAPEGRRMLRVEALNSQTPVERKPEWMRSKVKTGPAFIELKNLVQKEGLHTVCEEAGCPNIYECWEDKEATFLIGGAQCTRRCDFCQIDTGKPEALDPTEPIKVAESVRTMGLRYATVTGVARDDLSDEGSWLYAETIRQIHALNPGTGVEILIPDFTGHQDLIQTVIDARPEVFAHNVETVPRIFKAIRPAFRYDRSLDVIRQGSENAMVTKSNLILGMGETREEVSKALRDLRDAGCDLVTINQYLRPSQKHHPVSRWVKPQEFVELRTEAYGMGFLGVLSGPLVRSSYRAGRLWAEAMAKKGRDLPGELAHIAS
jgi:lipoic acid synthetase